MKEAYKNIVSGGIDDIFDWARHVTQTRDVDLSDFEAQLASNPKIYPAPASSTDLIGTEKAGDIAADTSYLYVVVDNAGTLRWQRVATATF